MFGLGKEAMDGTNPGKAYRSFQAAPTVNPSYVGHVSLILSPRQGQHLTESIHNLSRDCVEESSKYSYHSTDRRGPQPRGPSGGLCL